MSGVRRAFTIAELILVLTICSIVAAMAIPRMGNAQSRYQLDYAAKKLVADIERIRTNARFTGVTQYLAISTASSRYSTYSVPSSSTSYSNTLWGSPYYCKISAQSFGASALLTFDLYGLPSAGGTITLSAGASTRTVTIDASSGKASWK